ncbi:MAG: HU family DNA-binding protein [Anaeroplasma sp.]|nr:HU family DNA-binding protein [Anaeroplasma sp.]
MGYTVSSKAVYMGQLSERIAKELNVSQLRVKQILDKEFELMKEILLKGQNVAIKNFIQIKPVIKNAKTYYKSDNHTTYVKPDEATVKIEVPEYLWLKLEISDEFSNKLKGNPIPDMAYETIASIKRKNKCK